MSQPASQTISQILAATELFAGLSERQLAQTAAICQLVTFQKGEILFEENSSSDEMYIIGRGVVDILIDPSIVSELSNLEAVSIAKLRQGDVFGEMSLVDQGLRSASARVSSGDCVLIRLPRDPLLALCQTDAQLGFALMYNLAADLALKIRNTDLTLRQYQLKLMYRPRGG